MDRPAAGEMIGQSRRSSMAAPSTTTTAVSVPTPSRDLSFRRGAFTHNILRLEQSASEMSAGGSDIGEEIRRMNEAERLSRQNSVRSAGQQEGAALTLAATLDGSTTTTAAADTGASTRASRRWSSQAPKLVVVNNSNARSSGYDSDAFPGSPMEATLPSREIRTSTQRRASQLGPSALGDMIESSFEDRPLQLDLGFDAANHSRQPSQSSHTNSNGNAARRSQIFSVEITSPAMSSAILVEREDEDKEQAEDGNVSPLRSASADTFQQAQTAFMDFDGIHFSPDLNHPDDFVQLDREGNEIRQVSGKPTSRVPSMMLPSGASQPRLGLPPPDAGMIYYPAPVPRMLNLPKRLSQLPAANVQSKRRSEVMSQMLQPSRSSAAWLGDGLATADKRQSKMPEARTQLNERLSVANFANVPPQLRASVFFEHQTVVHEVDIKSESAVATLDSILAASATAPVSAFTDHPYAGDISKTAYAPEKMKRRSTANDLRLSTVNPDRKSKMMQRSSTAGDLPTRASTYGDPQASRSRVSVIDSDEVQYHQSSRLPAHIAEEDEDVDHEHMEEIDLDDRAEDEDEEFEDDLEYDGIEEYDEDELDPVFAQPTTLLGELQVRKAQQKSRNRTAATAFPNGMHSTLLQLDAVAQVNKNKRAHQRVNLAWEDPSLRDQDDANENVDEEVPLGMLFPNKNGLIARKMGDDNDWERPLGLMEKREMEDNEPLSSRRSRLRGEPIRPRAQHRATYIEPQVVTIDDDPDTMDDETLKQRARRMSTKNALDAAISDAVPIGERPISTFAEEMINELKLEEATDPVDTVNPEDETLGQRRARLQREKEAAEKTLQQRTSMSNLLNANPVGQRATSRQHVSTKGTLLYASEQAQAEHKQKMQLSNIRSTSYSARPQLQQSTSMANVMSPMYNMGMQMSASTPMLGVQPGGYFPPQPMGMAGYNPQMGMQQGGMVNHYAYAMLSGQQQMYNYSGMPMHTPMQMQMQMPVQNMGVPGMGYGYGTGMQPSMQQRSAIDQWRANIAQ